MNKPYEFKHPTKEEYIAFYKSPHGIAIVVYLIVMGLVSFLIPDDILTANPWARDFADFMASFIPQIDKITALGIKPDINRFYFSFLWACVPIMWGIFLSLLLSKPFDPKDWDNLFKVSIPRLCYLYIMGILFAIIWPQVLYAVHPEMRLTRSMLGSDLGRAISGQITFATGPAMFLFFTPIILYIRIKHRKNPK